METDKDKAGQVASILLSEDTPAQMYPRLERILYGMDADSIARVMRLVASRIRPVSDTSLKSQVGDDLYDTSFYEWVRYGALRSARAVVPILMEIVRPTSVVDVGCGDGTWLSVFLECGINRIQGFDGDWVDKKHLAIPDRAFRSVDLATLEFQTHERYDLVLSLECAEHLEERYAGRFVEMLCNLGSVVCFSAAIPFQGGVGHVNEQWPEYWTRLFAGNGYEVVDCVRPRIWGNPEVESWYAQNMLLFAQPTVIQANTALAEWRDKTDPDALLRVHPIHFLKLVMYLLPWFVREGIY